MNLQMDPLDNLLTTLPLRTNGEISLAPYPNFQFRIIANLDWQFGNISVPTQTGTRSDCR